MQKYTFEVQKYTFKLQKLKYSFNLQQYTFEVQKKSTLSKYKSITSRAQKYTFEVQSNFRHLGNRISGIRNLLNTFGSRNPVPRSRNHWNRFLEPRNPWSLSKPRNPLEPVPGTLEPWNLGTLEPIQTSEPIGTGSRNGSRNLPGTRFFPGTAPARPEHTETILCRDPIAFCCWGTILRSQMSLDDRNCWNLEKSTFSLNAPPRYCPQILLAYITPTSSPDHQFVCPKLYSNQNT